MGELITKESYIVDENGQRIGVVLSLSAYNALINRLNELEAFRAANDLDVMDALIKEDKPLSSPTLLPPMRQRRGPGGMIVI